MSRPGSERVLVTGAGGFVGSWLVPALERCLPAGSEILATGRARAGASTALDITDAAAVDAAVASFRPTCVIHLAAVSSLDEARIGTRQAWTVNLFGTFNLAEAVMREAPDARFIFTGSSEVYGGSFNRGAAVDESAPLDPRSVYATTKASADLMLGQMAEAGLRSVRFRPFNHTGPGQSTAFAIPAFASQIAAIERGKRPPVLKVGNLDARRDFLDVRDVVEAYRLAVLAPDLPHGCIFNVASGEPRRIGDALDTLLGLTTATVAVEHDEARMRFSDVPVTAGDAGALRDALGWSPRIAWSTTLGDVLDACRRQHA